MHGLRGRVTQEAKAIAYVRQVCALGLGAQLVMPLALQALRDVIPSCRNLFIGAATANRREFAIHEHLMPQALADDLPFRATGLPLAFGEQAPGRAQVHPGLQLECALHPGSLKCRHHFLDALVTRQGAPKGLIFLLRCEHEPAFTRREQELLNELLPYLSHAFDKPPTRSEAWIDSALQGVSILDGSGHLLYQSEKARQLLCLAADRRKSSGLTVHPPTDRLLRRLSRVIMPMFDNHNVPLLHLRNAWGRFVFRAFALQAVDPSADSHNNLITLTIDHQEPISVRVMRELRESPLSPVQREVCLLLARKVPRKTIACQLNIRPDTVKAHINAIYEKFGVNNRNSLLISLLGTVAGTME